MRIRDTFQDRPRRLLVFGVSFLAWILLVAGATTGIGWLWSVGAGLVAIVGLLMAKAIFELDSATTSLSQRIEAIQGRQAELGSKIDRARDEISELQGTIQGVHALRQEIESMRADTSLPDLQEQVGRLSAAHEVTHDALLGTRALVDRALGSAHLSKDRLSAATVRHIGSPLLSIAIPAFNRPKALAGLLSSLADGLSQCEPDMVEVCITDDASTDPAAVEVALEFAEAHQNASLHLQTSNVGIERNILDAGRVCRGDYLLLVGNDDLIAPGALTTILHDLAETEAPVLLYAKRRISLSGDPHPEVLGSVPIDLPEDGWQTFDTMVGAASRQGFLSTFGFIGPAVVMREPFLLVDPTPYLDLTMYAQVFVKMQAFLRGRVFFRNTPTIVQRSPTQAQKHSEALGRREEDFMRGGQSKLSRYFGTTLAAAFQRVIDRSNLDHDSVAAMPERLMTPLPLIEWIMRNRTLDPAMDEKLEPGVAADADRFFSSIAALSPPRP